MSQVDIKHKYQSDLLTRNPVSTSLITDNPAISLPYVKYYTSILEEYVDIRDIHGDTSDAIEAITSNSRKSHYDYPVYLQYKPYHSMNQFPLMLAYKSNSDIITKSYRKKMTIDKEIGILSPNPPPSEITGIKESDIIITYRATKTRSRFIKNRYHDISAELQARGGDLTRHLMIGMVKAGITGSSSSPGSQLNQYAMPIASVISSNLINLDNIKASLAEGKVDLLERRYKYIKDVAKKRVDDISTSINKATNHPSYDTINNKATAQMKIRAGTIFANLKAAIDSVDVGTDDQPSYLLVVAQIIAHSTYASHLLLESFIKYAGRTSYISDSTKIISELLRYTSEIMADILGIKQKYIKHTSGISNSNITSTTIFLKNLRGRMRKFLGSNSKLEDEIIEAFEDRFLAVYGLSANQIYELLRHIQSLKNKQRSNLDQQFINDANVYSAIQNIFAHTGTGRKGATRTVAFALIDNRVELKFKGEKADDFGIPDSVANGILRTSLSLRAAMLDSKHMLINADYPDSAGEKYTYNTIINKFNTGVLAISSLSRRVVTADIIRYKNLVIKNEEDLKNKTSTTVTKFSVGHTSNNVPIFMDGHENPTVQNLGGSIPTIDITCITNDAFMLDDITAACQELDITFRTRSELKAVNPLSATFGAFDSSIQSNSLLYNLSRTKLRNRLSKLAKGTSSMVGAGTADTPLLITNNIANMMGVYGCVLKQITVTSVENFPDTYQVDMSFLGVDVNQQFRETPRKRKVEIDPFMVSTDLCRMNLMSHALIGTPRGLVVQINNVQNSVNKMLSKLIVMNFMMNIISGNPISEKYTDAWPIPGFRYAHSVENRHWKLLQLSQVMIAQFVHDFASPLLTRLESLNNGTTTMEYTATIKRYYREHIKKFRKIIGSKSTYRLTLDKSKLKDMDISKEERKAIIEREGAIPEEGGGHTILQHYLNTASGRGSGFALWKDRKKVTGDRLINFYTSNKIVAAAPVAFGAVGIVAKYIIKGAEKILKWKPDHGKLSMTLMGYFLGEYISKRVYTKFGKYVRDGSGWFGWKKMTGGDKFTKFGDYEGITGLDLPSHIMYEIFNLTGFAESRKGNHETEYRSVINYLSLGTNDDQLDIYCDFTFAMMTQLFKSMRKNNILEAAVLLANKSKKINKEDKKLVTTLVSLATSSKENAEIISDKEIKDIIKVPIRDSSTTKRVRKAIGGSEEYENPINISRMDRRQRIGLQTYFCGEYASTAFRDLYTIKTANHLVERGTIKPHISGIKTTVRLFTWIKDLIASGKYTTYMRAVIKPSSGEAENILCSETAAFTSEFNINVVTSNKAGESTTHSPKKPSDVVKDLDKECQKNVYLIADAFISDKDAIKDSLGLFAQPDKLTHFAAQLIAYRIIDSLGKYIILPAIGKLIDYDSSDEIFERGDVDKIIIKVLNQIYRSGPISSDGNADSTYASLYKSLTSRKIDGDVNRMGVSEETIRRMALFMTKNATSMYDNYNAYPDRPLPVFGIKRRGQDSNPLSALQLFTSPDFFLWRDTRYTDTIIKTLEDRLVAGEAGLLLDEIKESKITDRSNMDVYRDVLLKIADSATETMTDKVLDYETQVSDLVSRTTRGKSDEDEIMNFLSGNSKSKAAKRWKSAAKMCLGVRDSLLDNPRMSRVERVYEALGKVAAAKTNDPELQKFEQSYQISQTLRGLVNNANQLDNIGDTVERLHDFRWRVSKKKGKGMISSQDISLARSLMNPSAGAYNVTSMELMKHKLIRLTAKMRSNAMISTTAMAFPTFKFYIIEEDAKELLFFNDFYEYSAVKSIKIHKSRKSASNTAYIELSNLYGNLTNIISGRRRSAENPFYLRPGSEESVNSMMLKVGALIQVRFGYSAHLGPESIAFSGKIQELQGTDQIIIVAQSHGVELTREIGGGAGKDFSGILDRIAGMSSGKQFGMSSTNTAMGLVAAILSEAKQPLRGMGTRSPYLGVSRLRNITDTHIAGVNSTETYTTGYLGSLVRWSSTTLTKKLTGIIDIKLIDSRLSNVNLSDLEGNNAFYTLFGRSRWLIQNETIWDSLQDYTLQLANKICTVRTFDEDNTLVIDSDDGIYQRSLENYTETSKLQPILTDLELGEKSTVYALSIISRYLRSEAATTSIEPKHRWIDKLVRKMLTYTARSMIPPEMAPSEYEEVKKEAEATLEDLMKLLKPNTKELKNTFKDYSEFANEYDKASNYAIGQMRKAVDEIISSGKKLSTTKKFRKVFGTEDTPKEVSDKFLLITALPGICKYLKHAISLTDTSLRPVSDIHLKSAAKDIIKNNIKAVAGYNKVELSYLDEDVFGSVLGIIGMAQIGSLIGVGRAITLDNVDKPSSRYSIFSSLSQTIDSDKVQVYSTFQKNAAIRGSILVDNPKVVSNSILANLVRDYYDGELILTMDPSIEPWDIIFLHDDVNDMWGVVQVKEVTHSFDPSTGAVTIVKPDVYVKNNIDSSRSTYSLWSKQFVGRIALASVSLVVTIAAWSLGAFLLKGAATLVTRLKVFSKVGTGSAKRFNRGIASKMMAKLTDSRGKTVSKEALKSIKNMFGSKAVKRILKATPELGKTPGEFTRKFLTGMKESLKNTGNQKHLKTAIGDTIKSIGSQNVGLDNAYESIFKNLYKTLKSHNALAQSDDVIKIFANSVDINPTAGKQLAKVMSNSMNIAHINSVLTTPNPLAGGGMIDLLRWGSSKQLRAMVSAGLSVKIGRAIIPNIDSFTSHLGEYLDQRPLTVAGLVHKGEPLMSNCDGMRKTDFPAFKDWLSYKVGESLNPLFEMVGNLEELMYQTKKQGQDIPFEF